jgi:predicted aldo/keto reductase-like oxidoreductase
MATIAEACCQIHHNYVNETHQTGRRGLEYAAAKGQAVVAIEPLLGGKLVDPPPSISEMWPTAAEQRAPVAWALDRLWHKPEVSVLLSGMSATNHVKQNVVAAEIKRRYAVGGGAGAGVPRAREKNDELCPVPCTQCRYCVPCPNGVNIPRSFSLSGTGVIYAKFPEARHGYARVQEESRASARKSARRASQSASGCP